MPVRRALMGLALAFSLYQVVRGMLWAPAAPGTPWLYVAALVAYGMITVAVLIAGRGISIDARAPEPRAPVWVAWVAAAGAAVLPTISVLALAPVPPDGATYGLWYIGGFGVISVALLVRRRKRWAWVTMALLAASTMLWLGVIGALARGLVGSILWVGVAQLAVRLIDKAGRDAERLEQLQSRAAAVEAAQDGRERERRMQLQRALAIGGPTLERIIAVHGSLSVAERRQAAIAEARLRDELRGPRLLDDEVRRAIDAARLRGAVVSVFDEGGLDNLSDAQLAVVRAQLAEAVSSSASPRLVVRTSPHERTVVTVVGRSADETSVDLWLEIERPAVS